MSCRRSQRPALSLTLLLVLLVWGPLPASAQISIGADFVNRYVWRGQDFGESFSIQPDLAYSTGPFTVGTWASYSIAADGAGANEHDIYAGLSFDHFSVGVTDYYFPAGGPGYLETIVENDSDAPNGSPKFFDEDSHMIEPNASVTGPEPFPITLYGAVNAIGDDDYSAYLEASYPFSVKGVDLGLALGATPYEGAYAPTFAFINARLSASKAIPITEEFALPVSASYILNPYTERSFLVFGLSLSTGI